MKKILSCAVKDCKGIGSINKKGIETFTKGYCHKHYQRLNKHNNIDYTPYIKSENRKKNPLYSTWQSIKNRCYNKNYKDFNYYGGRGIKVAKEWLGVAGFSQFLKTKSASPFMYEK